MDHNRQSIKDQKALLFFSYHPLATALAKAQAEEFKELVRAVGLKCQSFSHQVMKKIQPATFIGTGKVQEIKAIIQDNSIDLVVFDGGLSGIQIRNLEKEWQKGVIDRHQLILEIFAQRARTYEGKLQVELARALDELPRTVGAWMSSLSRQGGGIGTKGPGEKAIEKDRRAIKNRVRMIRQKLEKVRQVRKGHRALRKKHKVFNIALIGYTNAGKSAILNSLSQSQSVEVKNLPFMTLDPTVRKIHLGPSQKALLTDTVGFIQNLSPHLVSAFKATLEESESSDLLLHIIDLSSPLLPIQIKTVQNILKDLGWQDKPRIQVYNKIDLLPSEQNTYSTRPGPIIHRNYAPPDPKVFVSAKTGEGMDRLKKMLSQKIEELDTKKVQLYFPQNQEEKIYRLAQKACLLKKETSSLGTLCHARLHHSQLKEWEDFMVHPKNSPF